MLYCITTSEFIRYISAFGPEFLGEHSILDRFGYMLNNLEYEKGKSALALDLPRNKWPVNGHLCLSVEEFLKHCPSDDAYNVIVHYVQSMNGCLADFWGLNLAPYFKMSKHDRRVTMKSNFHTYLESHSDATWIITRYTNVKLTLKDEKVIVIPGELETRSKITANGAHIEWIYTSNFMLYTLFTSVKQITPEEFLKLLSDAHHEETVPRLTQNQVLHFLKDQLSRIENTGGREKAKELSEFEYLLTLKDDQRLLAIYPAALAEITSHHREEGIWGALKVNWLRSPTSHEDLLQMMSTCTTGMQPLKPHHSARTAAQAIPNNQGDNADQTHGRRTLHNQLSQLLIQDSLTFWQKNGLRMLLSLLEEPSTTLELKIYRHAANFYTQGPRYFSFFKAKPSSDSRATNSLNDDPIRLTF